MKVTQLIVIAFSLAMLGAALVPIQGQAPFSVVLFGFSGITVFSAFIKAVIKHSTKY